MKVRYSLVLLPVLIAYAYTVLRFQMNIEYRGATWAQLYNLTAPLPFGHRILVPLLSRPLVMFLGMSIKNAFFFYEFCFALVTVFTFYRIFQLYLDRKISYFLSILFLLLLPLPFLLKYQWPVYYPYDTASIFFMISGLYFVLKEKWPHLLLVMALGAVNRETMVFLIPLFSLLSLDRLSLKKHLGILAALAAVFVVCRLVINLELSTNKAEAIHFFVGKKLRVLNNYEWFLKKPLDNSVQFLASVCFLPVFWVMNRAHIPRGLKRIEIWAVLFFAPLLVAGNVYEPRIFGEIIAVLYVAVMPAIFSRLGMEVRCLDTHRTGEVPLVENSRLNKMLSKFIVGLDRYGLATICIVAAASIAVFIFLRV